MACEPNVSALNDFKCPTADQSPNAINEKKNVEPIFTVQKVAASQSKPNHNG